MSFGTRKNAVNVLSILSIAFFLFSTVISASMPVQNNGYNVITITEDLNRQEEYPDIFPDPPFTINLTGYWHNDNANRELQVKIAQSDLEDFDEMKHVIQDILSASSRVANGSKAETHQYENWNNLLSGSMNGTKVPIFSFNDNDSNYDISIRLTGEAHPNGRTAAQTLLYLDGKQIISAEITVYNADQSYKYGELVPIVKHELGHALGLGHSNYFGSIMYPNLVIINDEAIGTISECEIQGIESAYSTHEDNVECNLRTDN